MGLFLWDSEPSKIFVGDTAISKVFLWDTQVRPSGWAYSYDFTTWTISDFSSLWWSIPSQCSMSSSWLTSSGTWSTLDLSNVGWLNDALQNAKKVTMELVWYRIVSNRWEHAFSLINWNTEVNVLYGNWRNTQVIVWWTNVLNRTQSQATNTPHTMKSVCDLVNKSASYEDTWVPITWTATLSDTQISNIRDCNWLRLVVQTGVYIKSFSIKIE